MPKNINFWHCWTFFHFQHYCPSALLYCLKPATLVSRTNSLRIFWITCACSGVRSFCIYQLWLSSLLTIIFRKLLLKRSFSGERTHPIRTTTSRSLHFGTSKVVCLDDWVKWFFAQMNYNIRKLPPSINKNAQIWVSKLIKNRYKKSEKKCELFQIWMLNKIYKKHKTDRLKSESSSSALTALHSIAM